MRVINLLLEPINRSYMSLALFVKGDFNRTGLRSIRQGEEREREREREREKEKTLNDQIEGLVIDVAITIAFVSNL